MRRQRRTAPPPPSYSRIGAAASAAGTALATSAPALPYPWRLLHCRGNLLSLSSFHTGGPLYAVRRPFPS